MRDRVKQCAVTAAAFQSVRRLVPGRLVGKAGLAVLIAGVGLLCGGWIPLHNEGNPVPFGLAVVAVLVMAVALVRHARLPYWRLFKEGYRRWPP